MAIGTGARPGQHAGEINMTPMIDVLLVLIVIFMITQPMMQKAMDVQLPREDGSDHGDSIVLELGSDGTFAINRTPIKPGTLEQRLQSVFRQRAHKVLLLKAHPDVRYQDVVTAMDVARGAGVKVIGAVLPAGS
jgi:biopolymer transport protein TolR